MSEEKGITESLELIDGLEVIAVCVKKAYCDDNKINLGDVPEVLEAIKDPRLIEAIKGINEVVAEAKDYSTEEILAIGTSFIGMIGKVKNA